MKNKRAIFNFAICLCVFYSFNAFCQESRTEVSIEFINLTDTQANLAISEEIAKKPYIYSLIKNINLDPGQVELVPINLLENNNQKFTLSISATGGNGYGQTGSSINLDVSKSTVFTVELIECWVYPGDELWPPIEPFRVIKAHLVAEFTN